MAKFLFNINGSMHAGDHIDARGYVETVLEQCKKDAVFDKSQILIEEVDE